MDDITFPAPERERRRRRRTLAFLLTALTVGSITAGAFSLALFTSTASVGSNTFTTGTIVLGATMTPTSLTVSGMMPGDTVSGALAVANTGSGDLRYAMTTVADNTDGKALRDALVLTVKTLVGASCAVTTGATLYSGPLNGAAIGDPATGAQAGDRALAAGTSETLCFSAGLPLGAANTVQNATTTATFTFAAEQTKNN